MYVYIYIYIYVVVATLSPRRYEALSANYGSNQHIGRKGIMLITRNHRERQIQEPKWQAQPTQNIGQVPYPAREVQKQASTLANPTHSRGYWQQQWRRTGQLNGCSCDLGQADDVHSG